MLSALNAHRFLGSSAGNTSGGHAARRLVVVMGKGADRKKRWRHNRFNSPYRRGLPVEMTLSCSEGRGRRRAWQDACDAAWQRRRAVLPAAALVLLVLLAACATGIWLR